MLLDGGRGSHASSCERNLRVEEIEEYLVKPNSEHFPLFLSLKIHFFVDM